MACPCRIQKKLIQSPYQHDSEKEIYLDYNATTRPDRELLAAFQNLSLKNWGHPLSPHGAGSEAYRLSESAGEILNECFPSKEGRYLYCSSGTDSLYQGILLLKAHLSKQKGRFQFCISALSHPSAFAALEFHELSYCSVPVDSRGIMKLKQMELDSKPVILYPVVNHETGGIEEIEQIHDFARERKGIVFMDAVQAFPRLEERYWLPFCDLFCLSGHKFHTPKGMALLGISSPDMVIPESAMEMHDGIMKYILARGIQKHQKKREEMNRRLSIQENECLHFWNKAGIPYVLESPQKKVPGVLNISLKADIDMEDLFLYLANHNICISRFSACTGSVTGESSILTQMNRSTERSSRSLRLSGGRGTNSADWLRAGKIINDYLKSL